MKTQMKTFNSNTCRILSATCLSVLCLIALSTQAATITVTNTNDSGCRLTAPGDRGRQSTETRSTSTLAQWTDDHTDHRRTAGNKNVTINGPGSDNLTVDGNHASRVFHVSRRITATISGLTIRMVTPAWTTAVAAFKTIMLHCRSITARSAATTPPGAAVFTMTAPIAARV